MASADLFNYEWNRRYGEAGEHKDISVGNEIRENKKRDTDKQWNDGFLFLPVDKESKTYRTEYHGPDYLRGVSHPYSSVQRAP